MKTSKQTYRISFAVVAVAVALSTGAHAEYRCATPQQLDTEERRACDLAPQETPDALIQFVNRTKGIYNLYVNDYVSEADVKRWELAEQKGVPDSPAIAKAKGDARDSSMRD